MREFYVGLIWKIRMAANLLPYALPALSIYGELCVIDDDDKVGIAGGNFYAGNLHTAGNGNCTRRQPGHAHACGDLHGVTVRIMNRVYATEPEPRVRLDLQRVAGSCACCFSHPGGYAARTVATDLGYRTVGIMQTDAASFLIQFTAVPSNKFDAVRADAGIARAETAGQFCSS